MDKLCDENKSTSIINLITSNTEKSASNNDWLCSNYNTKIGAFTIKSADMKKVPFLEIEYSFLK